MDTILQITKRDVIDEIQKETMLSRQEIDNVMNAMGNVLFRFLSRADESQSVKINLMEGLYLTGEYKPEKIKTNHLTGKVIRTTKKIRPKASFTRSYCERLSDTL